MHRRVTISLAVVAMLIATSCGGDDGIEATSLQAGDPSPSTITIQSLDHFTREVAQLAEAYMAERPEVTIEISGGPGEQLLERIRSGASPDIYVDVQDRVRLLDDDERVSSRPVTLGFDRLTMVVAEDNPADVPGIEAFAIDSPFRTGACPPGTTCGVAAERALRLAEFDAAPDVFEENQEVLVQQVLDGQIDVALALQSGIRNAQAGYQTMQMPLTLDQRYEILAVGLGPSLPAQEFLRWIERSSQAESIMERRGYR